MDVKDPWTSEYINWFVRSEERIRTADGKEVELWEFRHTKDETVLSAWAKHFRNHYCLDTNIDFLRGKLSKSEYLNNLKFPSKETKLGPAVRAGDFGEILIADYLQWLLGYWVPRIRWSSKVTRDESPRGSDVVGFRFLNDYPNISSEDILFIFESKTKFSPSGEHRLQDAINSSAKDHIRIDESLNYIKQRLFERNDLEDVMRIERFQNPVDIPYTRNYGAALIISDEFFHTSEVTSADCRESTYSSPTKGYNPHPNIEDLILVVIRGSNMMDLVHDLYRRAADEA